MFELSRYFAANSASLLSDTSYFKQCSFITHGTEPLGGPSDKLVVGHNKCGGLGIHTTPGGLSWRTNSSGYVTDWSLENPSNIHRAENCRPGFDSRSGQTGAVQYVSRFERRTVLASNNPTLALNLLNAAQIWMEQVLQ